MALTRDHVEPHLLTDGPYEAGELTCEGSHNHCGLQRRRDDHTPMAKRRELAVDAVSAPPGFVAEIEFSVAGKPFGHLGNIFRHVRNHSQEPDRAVPSVFCNADRYGRLVDVHADERSGLHISSPPV